MSGFFPYRITRVFDAETLPAAFRREHSTRAGVWGVIRVLDGRLRLEYGDGSPGCVVTPEVPGLVLPEQTHMVEPLGDMRMRVEFYSRRPAL